MNKPKTRPLRTDYLFSYSDNFYNKEVSKKKGVKDPFTEFKKFSGDIDTLISIIQKGYAISPSYYEKNYRNKENVIASDLWIGDVDKGLRIEDFFNIDFFSKYSFIYTSPSHTPENHRFRIIIPLPSSVDAITYEQLSDYFDDLLDQKLDKAPKHSAAIFYGNDQANFFNVDNIEGLPYQFVNEIEEKSKRYRQAKVEEKQKKAKKTQEKIKKNLSNSSESKKKAIELMALLPKREKGSNQYEQLRNAIWGLTSLWTIESGLDFDSEEGNLAKEELLLLLENCPVQSDLKQGWDLEKLILNFDSSKGITAGSFFGYFKDQNIPINEDEGVTSKKPKKIRVAYELIDKIFEGRLRLNLLSQNIELDGESTDLENLYISLAVENGIEVSDKLAFDIAKEIGKKNQFHPVKDYFQNLKDEPELTLNIRQLASVIFGTNEPLYNEMFYRFLIASVARIFEPGCKVDTALVLQGAQGYRKSTFFKVLYSEDWFTDSVQGMDMNNLLTLHQYWCCELAELETITSKKEAGVLKAFLARSIDTFRKPYAKTSTPNKRQGVIVGSVNESEFLVDTTGDRRFWVIPIEQKIDTDLIKKWRDRIWFLAYQDYLNGEKWYLDEEQEKEVLERNKDYLFTDPWCTPELVDWLENLPDHKRTANYIFTFYFKFEEREINLQNSKRLGKILTSLGYSNNGRSRIEGKNLRFWIKK